MSVSNSKEPKMTRVNSAAIILETSHEITYSDGEHLFTVVAVPRARLTSLPLHFLAVCPEWWV